MNILGIAGLNHDPSVALLSDGKILMAIESEKVTRHKQEISFLPVEAIRLALSDSGISIRELDYITTNWSAGPLANRLYIPQLLRFVKRNCYPWALIPILVTISGTHRSTFFMKLQEEEMPPIVQVPHHLAHLGSCYTLSPFEEAVVAVVDGSGELSCTSLFYCAGRRVKKLYSMDLPLDSLGHLYTMATIHLGYEMLGDEYKVMGLAGYGERRIQYEEFFRDAIELLPEGRYRVNSPLVGNYLKNGYRFPKSIHSRICPPRLTQEEIKQEHKDFARCLQARLEEAIIHILRHVRSIAPTKNLCLAGGVALNCVANGRILETLDFAELFIPPAPHDAGTSLGSAAYYLYHHLGEERPAPLRSPYLGPQYSSQAIEHDISEFGLNYERLNEPARTAAELIAGGKVIGWFQQRAEFGPRALGNRSILADPRDPKIRHRVNALIKYREDYRPFAPALLAESMRDYFEHIDESPFMIFAGEVKKARRAEIAGVVHVDGTARPQSVDRAINPLFWDLINHFREITGIPVVLNTSFNVAGEPIVLSPRDAIRCFYGSGLDALVIDRFLLRK